mmetsp:Transcript_138281/g.195726  ORF Transcript_138281/g.195726 Transcript_138281/m.195726 type:complete len:122 (+) Transcript_138281:66-431(+)
MAAPQPHYFFIQNPDGTRTQHFGLPPAEYQQVASAPMNMGPPPAGYGQFPPYGGAAPGAPYAGLPQAQSMVTTPSMPYGVPGAPVASIAASQPEVAKMSAAEPKAPIKKSKKGKKSKGLCC